MDINDILNDEISNDRNRSLRFLQIEEPVYRVKAGSLPIRKDYSGKYVGTDETEVVISPEHERLIKYCHELVERDVKFRRRISQLCAEGFKIDLDTIFDNFDFGIDEKVLGRQKFRDLAFSGAEPRPKHAVKRQMMREALGLEPDAKDKMGAVELERTEKTEGLLEAIIHLFTR